MPCAFALSNDVDLIATDFSTGDYTQGFTDISNLPSDLTNALLNGWTGPYAGTGEAFTGLLNSGSLLESLLVTWPEQLAAALGESATTGTAEAVTATLPDLFGGLLKLPSNGRAGRGWTFVVHPALCLW